MSREVLTVSILHKDNHNMKFDACLGLQEQSQ
jgi:hypothetical protein